VSSGYWSSTTNANNTNNAWHVNFNNGNVNNNNKNNNYVRAVRSGKCKLLSFESVYNAYLDCRKRKRGTINALRFEADLLGNLLDLALELQKGTYRLSRSVCFVTTRPKVREIFAADFRDRIVHHLLVRELEKIWEPRFIYDSYASRKGKGIHAAVDRLQQFMRRATKSLKRPAWFLQLDIRSFFMSIDRHILYNIFAEKLDTLALPELPVLKWLLDTVIFHDCTADYYFKGNPEMLTRVPAHKSLFHVPEGKGLPIGNLTSQFFANVYLNELDQYVKRVLKCRFYIRYVDDFVLVSPHREQLALWHEKITHFLSGRLALELKAGARIRPLSDGVDFLGYITRPRYRLARRRVVNNLKNRLWEVREELVKTKNIGVSKVDVYDMTPEKVWKLQQVISSYLGHFKHANTWKLIHTIMQKNSWLKHYFFFANGKLTQRFSHKGIFRGFRSQFVFFKGRVGQAVLLVRMGKYFELYDADALFAHARLGLKLIADARNMKWSAGFPVRLLNLYIERILRTCRDVAVLEESENPGVRIKERYISKIYMMAAQPEGYARAGMGCWTPKSLEEIGR